MPIPPRTNVKSFNPEIERVLYQIQVIQEEAVGLFDGLSQAQFQWRPAPNAWSMAECFDHLNATAKGYLTNIEAACAKGRAAGVLGEGPYVYGFLGRFFHRLTLPPVKRRFPAPASFQPAPQKPIATILTEWDQSHQRMLRITEAASGLDLQRIKVPSPASSLLKTNLGIAFWILTAHEKRHMWQARNVRNAPGFPAA
jgi:hypothetical protein